MRERLDVILTAKGLSKSRTAAQQMIKSGDVTVNGTAVFKPSEQFDPENDNFAVSGASDVLKYVGRGGFKLETAINSFGLSLSGKTCLDIGASTGGFTDCMLQNGAKRVFAVDVGTNQLAEKLRNDSRVISLEKLDIRRVTDEIPEKIDFFGIDVSFISLKLILPELKRFSAKNAEGAALIKPQFECGHIKNGKNGVIKDSKLQEKIVADICGFAAALGFTDIKTVPSSILGGDGNKEFLMHFSLCGD